MGIKTRRRARESRASSPAPVRGTRRSHGEDVARFFESVLRRDARAFGGDDGTHRARATSRERDAGRAGAGRRRRARRTAILVSFADVLGGVFARVTPTESGAVRLLPSPPRRRARRRHLPTGFPRRPARKLRARGRTPHTSRTTHLAECRPFPRARLERRHAGRRRARLPRVGLSLATRQRQSDESHAAMQTINAARGRRGHPRAQRYDSDDPDDTGSNPAGDEDEDDDKVEPPKARRRHDNGGALARARKRTRARTRREDTPRTKIQTPNRRPRRQDERESGTWKRQSRSRSTDGDRDPSISTKPAKL